MVKSISALAIVAAVCAALAGCASQPGGTVSTGTVAAPAAATDTSNVNLRFGQQYNGPTLSVGLSEPRPYTPSDSMFTSAPTGKYVTLNIRVADNTSQSFPTMELDVQAQSGGGVAEEIQDSANKVGSSTATILPHQSLTWQIAFAVPPTAHDLTLQVSALSGGKTIVFTGSI